MVSKLEIFNASGRGHTNCVT